MLDICQLAAVLAPSSKGDDMNSSALTELKELLWSESRTHVVTGSYHIAAFAYGQVKM